MVIRSQVTENLTVVYIIELPLVLAFLFFLLLPTVLNFFNVAKGRTTGADISEYSLSAG